MSYAFALTEKPLSWPAELEGWTDAKYKTPQACRWADACVYKGCCGFVHPGEEGTGLKFFPGRVTTTNGVSQWEPPVVRLIGSPTFYKRRRLRMSWPQWCAESGLPAPVPLSQRAPAPAPYPADCSMLSLTAPDILYPAMRAKVTADTKNRLGDLLYPMVEAILTQNKEQMAEADAWHESMTPGKVVGMFLEGIDLPELEELTQSADALNERVVEACDILYQKANEAA